MGNHDSSFVLSQAEYKALAIDHYTVRRLRRESERSARQVGLTPQLHELLLSIIGFADGPAPDVADIAERLQLQRNAVSGLIERAERRRLVWRKRRPDDHRRVEIGLTAEGIDVLNTLAPSHRLELDEIAKRKTTEDS